MTRIFDNHSIHGIAVDIHHRHKNRVGAGAAAIAGVGNEIGFGYDVINRGFGRFRRGRWFGRIGRRAKRGRGRGGGVGGHNRNGGNGRIGGWAAVGVAVGMGVSVGVGVAVGGRVGVRVGVGVARAAIMDSVLVPRASASKNRFSVSVSALTAICLNITVNHKRDILLDIGQPQSRQSLLRCF